MAKITIFLALILPTTLALLAAAAQESSNVLLTGDVLEEGRSLLGQDATFIMQGDCNLVLYDYGPSGGFFGSNTWRRDVNCSVTLNDVGQLVITGSRGVTIWTSTPSSSNTRGRYAAVLRPDNVVAIYGPMVWSTPINTSGFSAAARNSSSRSLSTTSANNMMFSGEALRSQSQLISGRDYRFVIQSECNLALFHGGTIIWNTNTRGRGANCFVRLGHDGGLAVADDRNRIVWSNNFRSTAAGDYVLVLQTNGQAAIYGPIVWSTATNSVVLPGFSVV